MPIPSTAPHEPAGVDTRREHDFLGVKDIPSDAYWGVHTARAVENFPISGQPIGNWHDLVRALAFVKKAAARANQKLGVIEPRLADAIVLACDDLIGGRLHEQCSGKGEQDRRLVQLWHNGPLGKKRRQYHSVACLVGMRARLFLGLGNKTGRWGTPLNSHTL